MIQELQQELQDQKEIANDLEQRNRTLQEQYDKLKVEKDSLQHDYLLMNVDYQKLQEEIKQRRVFKCEERMDVVGEAPIVRKAREAEYLPIIIS